MIPRMLGFALLAGSVLLAACDDDPASPGSTTTAKVRVVNATSSNLDIGTGTNFAAGNRNLAFGASASCMTVNAASPNLAFRQNGQTTNIGGFTPTFAAGGNYVVVVTGGPGAYSFRTVPAPATTPTLTAANGAVRVINATSGTTGYDVYLTAPGAAFGTANMSNLGAGVGTSWFTFPAGNAQLRLTNTGGTSTVAFDNTSFSLAGNSFQTFVIADAATTGGALRGFTVDRCE